jgi:hypothetical protein
MKMLTDHLKPAFTSIVILVLLFLCNACSEDDPILRDGLPINEGTPEETQTNIGITMPTVEVDGNTATVTAEFISLDPAFPIEEH